MPETTIHKLTVYKLAEASLGDLDFPNYSLVARGRRKVNEQTCHFRLFFLKNQKRPAKWLSVFKPLIDLTKDQEPSTMGSGFILAVQTASSSYAVTGGVGGFDLCKRVSIERRFGLHLAQRMLEMPELRGLSQKDTGGVVNVLDRVFRGSYNPSGDINNLKRVLTHIRGKIKKWNPLYRTIGRSIRAGDSLTVTGQKEFDEIIAFLVGVDEISRRRTVKISIPQLEQINRKTYGPLLDQLKNKLIRDLVNYSENEKHSLFLDTEEMGYLPDRVDHYELLYNYEKFSEETYEDVFRRVKDILSTFSTVEDKDRGFDRIRLRVHFDDGGEETKPLSFFVCGDVEYGNDVYFLNNEKWYRASDDYLTTITKELDNIKCIDPADLGMISWSSSFEDEARFNYAHSTPIPMDKRLVNITGEKGGIEFCDLLKVTRDEVSLIHVKRESGAPLRGLFAQGFVSAKLYAESDEFRAKVHRHTFTGGARKLSGDEKAVLKKLAAYKRHQVKVVYAIYDDTPSHKIESVEVVTSNILQKTLSTFAKVDLLERVTSMRSMGYDVAISRIKPYPR